MATMTADNPLLQDWTGPYGLPPFDRIAPDHFPPAFEAAMQEHLQEVEAIAGSAEPATFENTVAALDRCGRRLSRIASVFYNLTASETNPELQAVQRQMAAPLAAHWAKVSANRALFRRLDELFSARESLGLDAESSRLLERMHMEFVRSGARLPPEAQARHSAVQEELASLMTRFGQNVLHDETEHVLWLEGEADLAGLPDFVRAAAAQAATERGRPGGHVITLSRSLVVPFLTFSERRDLRESAWRAWVSRGEHAGEHDNREIVRDILRLRHELAGLHGAACFADHALEDRMAGTPAAVQKLLDDVWPRALAAVQREEEALRGAMLAAGVDTPLQAWDWRYWAERVRVARYAVDDAEVKPYFPLERVVEAAFDCAGRLFGLGFRPNASLPVYHPDVKAYEVTNREGQVVGLFMQDNFARASKRSGAWMSSLRWQSRNGGFEIPVILNNNNFAKGSPGQPTLLSLDDARTLFHEFGHGLHGLLSDVRYEHLSGTQVLRDFVELPSQIFEHWIEEPEVLRRHARHHLTGEPIPEDLLARLKAAQQFNQGYETVRYTASAIVDMAVHSLTDREPPADPCAFEEQVLARAGLPPAVGLNHRLVHFQHLFASSGYAAGYYVYLWAEVLDADGYGAFEEAGDPFDPVIAERLRRYIYASGNTLDPAVAYQAFRGRAPTVEPLLRQRGLLADEATV